MSSIFTYDEEVENLDKISNIADVGFWKFNIQRRRLRWNDVMYRIYECEADSFNESIEYWEQLIHPDDREEAVRLFNKSIKNRERYQFTYRIITSTGKVKYICSNAGFISKNIYTGTVQDISEYLVLKKKASQAVEVYREFIKQTPHAVAMFDSEMKYLTASGKWLQDYHIDDDIIGKSHYEVFPEIDDNWKKIHRSCLSGKVHKSEKSKFTRADGSVQYLRWDIRPWTNLKGEISGILMFTEDITRDVIVQREKEQISEILKDSQTAAKIGSWQVYLDSNKLFWDSETRRIHEVDENYSPNVETAINFYKEGEDRRAIMTSLEKCIKEGKTFNEELKIITAKNNEIWVRAIGKPVFNDFGAVEKVTGVFQDIDDFKTKEGALIENINRFEAAFIHSAIGMALVSIDGKFLRVNRTLSEYFMQSAEVLTNSFLVNFLHPEDENIDSDKHTQCLLGKLNSYSSIRRVKRANGAFFFAKFSVALIRDMHNEPLYFVYQIEDITSSINDRKELRKNNLELKKLTEQLISQNNSLRDFAQITSHNLRSPVANLKALTTMLNDPVNKEERDFLSEKITEVVKQLEETLNELIDALIIKNDDALPMTSVDIRKKFHSVKSCFSELISECSIEIEENFSANTIIGNEKYIESIFINLLSNAIKYRHLERQPKIKVSSFELDDESIGLCFEDNGIGIDLKRNKRKLFGFKKTFHRNPDAKGVGLFMVKSQVEAMNGTIEAESEVNIGTKFILKFNNKHEQESNLRNR